MAGPAKYERVPLSEEQKPSNPSFIMDDEDDDDDTPLAASVPLNLHDSDDENDFVEHTINLDAPSQSRPSPSAESSFNGEATSSSQPRPYSPTASPPVYPPPPGDPTADPTVTNPFHRPRAPLRIPQTVGGGSDGVFSHMAAKPETPGKLYQEMEPPSYNEAVHDSSPPYVETTIVTSFGDDGDVLIEGFPVGNFFIFFTNMVVSMSFDTIGFLFTALLATSHAAKHGARAGLGITLIRYGFYTKSQSVDDELAEYRYYDPDGPETTREDIQAQNEWTAYILFMLGFFILLHAHAEYIRVRRLRSVILSGSEIQA